MIDFMVIGLPRSGTSWAAAWLTTDATHCTHDPLYQHHYDAWDQLPRVGVSGVSCTGIWRFPAFLRDHPARKLILRRPWQECQQSLDRLEMPAQLDAASEAALDALDGIHMPWTHLFDAAAAPTIWGYLTGGLSFNAARHAALVELSIQPNFERIPVNRAAVRRLYGELRTL